MKAPTTLHVELTTACTYRCRHCYNYWQHESAPTATMTAVQVNRLIDQAVEHGVSHMIFTGGEVMTNYEVLRSALWGLRKTDISVSVNTNLSLATPYRMAELASLGLPHLLTSLNSDHPMTNDSMASRDGAWQMTVDGIRMAVDAGIKVSSNMIVTQRNKRDVYTTGKLLAGLGVSNFFTTRMVPCKGSTENDQPLKKEEERGLILDEAIRAKGDFGINVGSLIQYPVCFLQDTEKYADYIGRGCPGGSKMLCVHANGDAVACLHEPKGYGNVFKDGLGACWEVMEFWRDGTIIPDRCKACSWLPACEGACRIYADGLYGMDLLAGDETTLPEYKPVRRLISWGEKHDRS